MLAARVTLVIMVASLSKDEVDVISVTEREELRLRTLPPPDWQISLCRSDCTIEEGQYYYSDGFVGESIDVINNAVLLKAHVATFVGGAGFESSCHTNRSRINLFQLSNRGDLSRKLLSFVVLEI
jgi:hypothetical protein